MYISSLSSIKQIQLHYANAMKFSTYMVLQSSRNSAKLGKLMNKLLGDSRNRKKKLYFNALPSGGTPEFFDYVSSSKHSSCNEKRSSALNKIFMRNITDIMSTGELCPELIERGIQISKVKITSTFHQINVHWLTDGTKEDEKTEQLLGKLAPKLRHELSQLQIMGCVPKIEFIKDSSHLKYLVLENILKTVDFGKDFEPTPLANDWKSDYAPEISLSPEIKVDEYDGLESSISETPLPVMRTDVFGLDHGSIMSRISQSVLKAKATHRKDHSVKPLLEHCENPDEAVVLNSKERKKLFRDYLSKKAVERRKANTKERHSSRPEKLIFEQEMKSRFANQSIERFEEDSHELDEFTSNDSYLEIDDNYPLNK